LSDTAKPKILRRGMMLVLSSPSGAGKTTLSRRLLDIDDNFELSVSVTTRKPRPGERDGVDYNFISNAEFERMREAGDLLESALVFDYHYGTPRKPVEHALAAGRDVLFDIDWQGAQLLSENMRDDLVMVFILPPTGTALEARLTARAQDPPDVVQRRMKGASGEITHWDSYDYVLINDDADECEHELVSIIAAERLKRTRQTGLTEFVRDIQTQLSGD
jgi:guanylate kinase